MMVNLVNAGNIGRRARHGVGRSHPRTDASRSRQVVYPSPPTAHRALEQTRGVEGEG